MSMVFGLFAFFFMLAAIGAVLFGLVRPKTFQRGDGPIPTRKRIVAYGAGAFFGGSLILSMAASNDKGGQQPAQAATPAPAAPAQSAEVMRVAAEQKAKQKAEADAACIQNKDCAFKTHDIEARSSCNVAVEREAEERAKYEVKFDDSMFSNPFFDKSGFKAGAAKGTHVLIYSGNRVLFQNGFGAFQRVRYYCSYNLDLKMVEQVQFDQS